MASNWSATVLCNEFAPFQGKLVALAVCANCGYMSVQVEVIVKVGWGPRATTARTEAAIDAGDSGDLQPCPIVPDKGPWSDAFLYECACTERASPMMIVWVE